MHNHLEDNFNLSNKKALFYNMKKYLDLLGTDPFTVIPLTFHIKRETELEQDIEFQTFKKEFERRSLITGEMNVWIVKPGE